MGNTFEKIGSAKTFEGGVYYEEGVYPVVRVDALKLITRHNGHEMFIVESTVLQSQNPKCPPGSSRSVAYNLTKHPDSAYGNARKVIAQVSGLPVENVDPEGAQLACSTDNPFGGTLCSVEAYTTKTRAGGDFTNVRFARLPDEVQERRAEFEAALIKK